MKAMARHRSHSIEFKRQVAQEFIAGETLHGLAARHGVSRNLIRWVMKFEAGAFDEDAEAAGLLQEYEAKIAALERMTNWNDNPPSSLRLPQTDMMAVVGINQCI